MVGEIKRICGLRYIIQIDAAYKQEHLDLILVERVAPQGRGSVVMNAEVFFALIYTTIG